jgi:spore maturation protein CgeB
VVSIITDGWSDRIAVQVKCGSTLRTLSKALTKVGVTFDKQFAKGIVDPSVDRNNRPILINPDLILVIESAARVAFDFSKFQVPTAFFVIDPYIGFEEHIQKVRVQSYDFVFVSQRDCVKKYKEAGCTNVEWLPFACDPEIHGRVPADPKYNVCFVGSIHPKWGAERKRLIDLIGSKFQNCWSGQAFGRAMASLFSSSRIVFNKSIFGELNMRVFEGMASGSLLMTDRIQNGLLELFSENEEMICYRGDDELISKISHYLEHSEERIGIAEQGYRAATSTHTYAHRARQVLTTMAP